MYQALSTDSPGLRRQSIGKMTTFTLSFDLCLAFIVLSCVSHSAKGEIIAQGNLIYIKSERTATLNPTFVNFHRRFDFDIIQISLDTLDAFMKFYKQFCNEADANYFIEPKTYVINNATFREAQFKCQEFKATLPEIHNSIEANYLAKQIIQYNLTEVFAGINWVEERYQSVTTFETIDYTKTIECKECPEAHKLDWRAYEYIKQKQGAEVHFLYTVSKSNNLVIIPKGHVPNKDCISRKLLCYSKKQVAITPLRAMAKHSCIRDEAELLRINQNLRDEVAQFATPRQKRSKRAIGLIGAGIGAGFLGLESLNSIINGMAPLSLMGKGIAALFGFATDSDLRLTKTQLEKHSQAIANLSINQKQLIAAYQQVNSDIEAMQQAHLHLEHDVGVLFANLDNKLTVRNLQSLLQMTLLKMSQAISAAVQHHTSPFVFGTADLKNLSDVFRQKNVPLTDNINDVITSLAVVDNFYTFIFSAPILKTKNELHLYEIRDLPVYNKNLQYKAKVEHRYYAISLTSAEYTVLSDAEYYLCKNYFVCTAAAPFKIIGPNSPCELLTIKYQTNRCALEEFVGPAEQFLTYGNITYYSVPEPIEIHITCDESNGSTNRHQEIYGTGKIEIAPGCNIKISENANIRPSYVISRHNLEGDSFFKFLNVSGMPFVYPTTTKPPNVTRTPIVFREVASLKEAINIVFNQDTTLAEAIRIIIYLITIFSILATIYCCYPRFRLWFNGCCFITKPTKYWRDVRGYVVPDFISRNRQLQADNIGSIEKVDEIELQVVSAPREPEIKPSENKIAENIQPPYPFNRLTRLYSPLLINSLRKQ